MEVQVTHKLTPAQVEQACIEFVQRLVADPEPAEPAAPVVPTYDLTDVITAVDANPYRANSERYKRYQLFKVGESLQMAKSQGVHKRDIENALVQGYIGIAIAKPL